MASTSNPNTQTAPATVPANVVTLPQTAQLEALYTIIRDKKTPRCMRHIRRQRIVLNDYLLQEESSYSTVTGSYDCWSRKVSAKLRNVEACQCEGIGLNHLPVIPKTVETPTGATYEGVAFEGRICGVSILRAGEVCLKRC